jgi:hypothetical protein
LDFRSGIVLGQKMRVNEKGMQYLSEISWVREAREEHAREEATRPVPPRRRKRRR